MRIALDYDDTFTADPTFWRAFIHLALNFGHDVKIVTMRTFPHDHDQGTKELSLLVPFVWCDGRPKKSVIDDIDIWIDDHPEGIHMGSSFTPEMLEEWRGNGRTKRV